MRISDWSSDVCSSDLDRPCDKGVAGYRTRGLLSGKSIYRGAGVFDDLGVALDVFAHEGIQFCRTAADRHGGLAFEQASALASTRSFTSAGPTPTPRSHAANARRIRARPEERRGGKGWCRTISTRGV